MVNSFPFSQAFRENFRKKGVDFYVSTLVQSL